MPFQDLCPGYLLEALTFVVIFVRSALRIDLKICLFIKKGPPEKIDTGSPEGKLLHHSLQ